MRLRYGLVAQAVGTRKKHRTPANAGRQNIPSTNQHVTNTNVSRIQPRIADRRKSHANAEMTEIATEARKTR
jgi:hypothetical protein